MPAAAPFDEVYVRAATLSYDGERLVPTLPQRFVKGERRPVHLVLNFDGGATRHFGEFATEELALVVGDTYEAASAAAKRQGIQVVGLQLDLDCPSRLLPKYAELCREVKGRVGKATLSVTGLTSWLTESGLDDLVGAIDRFVPQFYEGRLPQRFQDDVPVSDADRYLAAIERLSRLDRPYLVGIAAYGQALLFDPKGKLAGTYRGLSIADAFRHPSLRLDSSREVAGERHVRFVAVRPDARGRGLGYGILFRLPTPASFAAALEAVRRDRPVNCLGAAIFRLPEEGEAATLPIATMTAVIAGRKPSPRIRPATTRRANPYALIEGTAAEPSEHVRVAIENVGESPRLETSPITVNVRFRAGCAEQVNIDHADRAVPFGPVPGRVSLARATGVRFERTYVGVGEKVDLGTVRLRPGCTVDIRR